MDRVKLTGLWWHESEGAGKFLSGTISKTAALMILPNQNKIGSNSPDFHAFLINPNSSDEHKDKD